MFDWDGVLVTPTDDSFSIMKEAFGHVFMDSSPSKFIAYEKIDWPKVFGETKGSTENWLVQVVCEQLGIPQREIAPLKTAFIAERERLILDYNHHRGIEYFDDGNVFEDAHLLLKGINEVYPEAIIAIVSGNPSSILNGRVPRELRTSFDFWIGGEYGRYRHEMVKIAQNQAVDLGWEPKYDKEKKLLNGFYFDDSLHAVIDVLYRGEARTIYVARPGEKQNNFGTLNAVLRLMDNWPEGEKKRPWNYFTGKITRYSPILHVTHHLGPNTGITPYEVLEHARTGDLNSLRHHNFLLDTHEESQFGSFLKPEWHEGWPHSGQKEGQPRAGKERF